MANYTSDLKTWGSTGSEFPASYAYVEGEQPVDEWDNFVNFNVIDDIINHLVPLTNKRIESDYGTAGNEPSSPDSANLYYDTSNERLKHWDADTNGWRDIVTSSDDVTVNAGDGLKGGGSFSPLGGSTTLNIEPANFAGAGLEDDGNDDLRIASSAAGDGLTGGAGTGLAVSASALAGSGLEDDGSNNLRLQYNNVTVAGNTVALGGSVGVSLGDLSNVTASGEGHGGGFNADTVDGFEGAALETTTAEIEDASLMHNEGFAPGFGG